MTLRQSYAFHIGWENGSWACRETEWERECGEKVKRCDYGKEFLRHSAVRYKGNEKKTLTET